MKRKSRRKCLAAGLSFVMAVMVGVNGLAGLVLRGEVGNWSVVTSKAATDYGLSNPRVEMLTRDCIEFGSYWQEDTNGDGVADQKDEKTPVKWQILSETDTDGDGKTDDLFLMADQVLDCKKYNEENKDVTWETCTLREWLNSEFYDAAFSDSEKSSIKDTVLTDENGTIDKLFLLSISEITNSTYGWFCADLNFYAQERLSEATSYAKMQGCYVNSEGICDWWLRSIGRVNNNAAYVDRNGVANNGGCNCNNYLGIRPVLHVSAENVIISSALQSKKTEKIALVKSTWDTVTLGTYNGTKIIWRVLSVEDNDAFLLADQILLKKEYNENHQDVTWESSTLRKWLNNDFYKEAFSVDEQAAIMATTLENIDNPFYRTNGGNSTIDFVYLLSFSDIVNPAFGFSNRYWCQTAFRQAYFSESKDIKYWWLRSPGCNSWDAARVLDDGYTDMLGIYADSNDNGVRPALHLNLSSSVWEKGEEVTSDDKKTAIIDSLPNEEHDKKDNGNNNNKTNDSKATVSGENNENRTVEKGSSSGVTSVSAPSKVKSLKVTNKKKGKTVVSFKKVSGASGYQIQYAKNKKFTKGKKSKTTKKTKYTIKKLKKKKTYYFRVRAYAKDSSGNKKYGKWSAVKKLKVKK